MFDSKSLFNKAKNMANKAMEAEQKITDNITNKILDKETQKNVQNHSMYEPFAPTLGVGRKFAFTENSLIYGQEEYLYSNLTTIDIISLPTKISDGEARTVASNGTTLNLIYSQNQSERLSRMIMYANQKINATNGKGQKYLYLLQTKDGIKIEVYEEYIILYILEGGISNMMRNSFSDGGSGKVISYSDLSIQMYKENNGNTVSLHLEYNNGKENEILQIPLNSFNIEIAETIVKYIHERPESAMTKTEGVTNESWEPVHGVDKEFTVNGKSLKITASMDIYNTYRLKFKELALACSDSARKEYDKKVINLTTFLEFFPKIYGYYLGLIIPKATEICISKGIYTETNDSIFQNHINTFHTAFDIYNIVVERIESTSQENQKQMAGILGNIPRLVGGGFGTAGAVKGIAKAEIFNTVMDTVESNVVSGAASLNNAQQEELYGQIMPDGLFARVSDDYWNTYTLLINILNNNGEKIWEPSPEIKQQCDNVFKNLSNPAFPKEKVLDVLLDIISKNPYNADYFNFLTSYCGETDEVKVIKDYFGY